MNVPRGEVAGEQPDLRMFLVWGFGKKGGHDDDDDDVVGRCRGGEASNEKDKTERGRNTKVRKEMIPRWVGRTFRPDQRDGGDARATSSVAVATLPAPRRPRRRFVLLLYCGCYIPLQYRGRTFLSVSVWLFRFAAATVPLLTANITCKRNERR